MRKILTKRQRSYPYQSDLRASDTQTTDQLASAIFDSGSKSSYEKDVGTNCANIDICPDFLIGALFAAGAAAFYVLYAAITKAGRRKKRKAEQYPLLTQVQDILYQGTFLISSFKTLKHIKAQNEIIYIMMYSLT